MTDDHRNSDRRCHDCQNLLKSKNNKLTGCWFIINVVNELHIILPPFSRYNTFSALLCKAEIDQETGKKD